MRPRNLRQRTTRYRLGPLRPASPRRASLPKAARLDNLARAVVAGVGEDDVNLRFKVQGSRFPILRFPVPRFPVQKRIMRSARDQSSKILENQMRTMNPEP